MLFLSESLGLSFHCNVWNHQQPSPGHKLVTNSSQDQQHRHPCQHKANRFCLSASVGLCSTACPQSTGLFDPKWGALPLYENECQVCLINLTTSSTSTLNLESFRDGSTPWSHPKSLVNRCSSPKIIKIYSIFIVNINNQNILHWYRYRVYLINININNKYRVQYMWIIYCQYSYVMLISSRFWSIPFTRLLASEWKAGLRSCCGDLSVLSDSPSGNIAS